LGGKRQDEKLHTNANPEKEKTAGGGGGYWGVVKKNRNQGGKRGRPGIHGGGTYTSVRPLKRGSWGGKVNTKKGGPKGGIKGGKSFRRHLSPSKQRNKTICPSP